jgi:hypothetical protein
MKSFYLGINVRVPEIHFVLNIVLAAYASNKSLLSEYYDKVCFDRRSLRLHPVETPNLENK